MNRVRFSTIATNTFAVRILSTVNSGTHGNTWFQSVANTITDNKWTLDNQVAPNTDISTRYILNVRDSSVANIWARDTFYVDTLSTSPGKVEFSTSGAIQNATHGNTYSHCVFRVNGDLGYQHGSNYDLHEFNQYISKQSFTFPSAGDTMRYITFRHNTFLVENPATVYTSYDSTTAYKGDNNRFVSNIFVSNGSTQGAHVALKWWSGGGVRDTNLVFCTTQDSANAYDRPSTDGDAHSHWGDPVFANERWETADLTPSPKYIANSSDLWKDGYVGAIDPGPYTPVLDIYQLILPDAKKDVYYEVRLRAVNGAPVYVWSISNGSLPTGLTLDPDQGILSGIPTTEGTTSFFLTVTDDLLDTAVREFSISVGASGLTRPPRPWWCWWCRP